MKRIVAGILAHVDSGKTTLSEGLLYCAGEIRRMGRVDHKDAFLDTHHIEQDRGITIFSKQAILHTPEGTVTLLDTPGHVDFSAEMERTLQVLDYAILVISGSEGIQSHTETLWDLLLKYGIPTFIFINKTDLPGVERDGIIYELKKSFGDGCVDFSKGKTDAFYEDIAILDEKLMNGFLEKGTVDEGDIRCAIKSRKVFPCYFGAALKMEGVEEFLKGFDSYTESTEDNAAFGAKVFKIGEDDKGERLTYIKITGGSLKVKEPVSYGKKGASEKVNQLRLYSGARFSLTDEVFKGQVCAVTGLTKTLPGMGLGSEPDGEGAVIEPVLNYRIDLKEGTDIHDALAKLRRLEEEEPQFHIVWDEHHGEIHIRVMGEVQLEVLKLIMQERFGMDVEFSDGNILYKETILSPVEGVGHYEPLRHYAEVHLLLEPLPEGSGLEFLTDCSEDKLDRNWQRLIMTHLEEKTHLGVLTGSPITDMKITLVAGKAHLKHTEGGDFRQATYRAVRQGLMMGESVLLEPWYDFKLYIPGDAVGRAMTDINNMGGELSPAETAGEFTVIKGSAPVARMRNYHSEVTSYTRGKGRLSCFIKGYRPCHNAEEVIESYGYDSEADTENTADSVFCSHGAGFLVKWDKVRDYMHIDSGINLSGEEEPEGNVKKYIESIVDDNELMKIFERTYGPVKRETYKESQVRRVTASPKIKFKARPLPEGPEYLLVDGYNIIFAWEELKELAKENLELARHRLTETLCEYQGVRQCEVILVFDAYKVKNNPGTVERVRNISVVYTKEAETADMYIERVTHELGKKHRVRVATSDGTEQLIILAGGALRVSAESFFKEVEAVKKEIRDFLKDLGKR